MGWARTYHGEADADAVDGAAGDEDRQRGCCRFDEGAREVERSAERDLAASAE